MTDPVPLKERVYDPQGRIWSEQYGRWIDEADLDEIERLRTTLRGIQSCSTCGACRGAATIALGEPPGIPAHLEMLAKGTAPEPAAEWQPIETAPPTDRNNPVYVAYPRFNNANGSMVPDEYICFTAYCDNLGWDTGFWRLHDMPHYWHPLPKAPVVMRDGLQITRPSLTRSAQPPRAE